jgi:rod shape-determining protein MreD
MGVGAVCGLLQDGVGSVVFGVHFLSKVVVGYVVSLASGRLIADQPGTHAALIAGATVLEVAVVAATGFVLGQRLDLRSPGALVASLAVNVVVGWVAFSVAGQARRRDRRARGFR